MLVHKISPPTAPSGGRTVAVLLHGRGSHRGDLQALRPNLPDGWWLVTPQAPHPGHPWNYGPGWAWYRYLAEDRVDDETLRQSLEALDGFLAELPSLVGGDVDHVVLGGFSQGGTTSMTYALTRPQAVDAALNFSGFLPDSPLLAEETLTAESTPIFWGHGERDPNIPLALARKGRARLRAAGARLEERDYEIGHWIVPEELSDAVAMVQASAR